MKKITGALILVMAIFALMQCHSEKEEGQASAGPDLAVDQTHVRNHRDRHEERQITLSNMSDFRSLMFLPSYHINVGPFHLLQDGSIKGAHLSQCSSTISGIWYLREKKLFLQIEDLYSFETCAGESAPYRSRLYNYTVIELKCEDSNDGSGGHGTALTANGGEFDLLCDF